MSLATVHYLAPVTGADFVKAIVDAASALAAHLEQEAQLRSQRDALIRDAVTVMRPTDGRRTLSRLDEMIRREAVDRGLDPEYLALSGENLRKISKEL